MTDEKIVDLFFERNETAISLCDLKYGGRLLAFGNKITEDTATSEECVNDTYMRTWETVPPKDPRNYLYAFLSKIMRNLCLDRIRANCREKRSTKLTVLSDEITESMPSSDNADNEILAKELTEIIKKFVCSLKEEAKDIFILRYFYMDELSDIAQKLSITEGKVKTVLKRTRDKLKIFLEIYGYTF